MEIKNGPLLVYFECPVDLRHETWSAGYITLTEGGVFNVFHSDGHLEKSQFCPPIVLSSEWIVISSTSVLPPKSVPTLSEEKQHSQLFCLTKPPDTTIWFLADSTNARDQWVEAILPNITVKPSTPPTRLPQYSEYNNWPSSVGEISPTTIVLQPKSSPMLPGAHCAPVMKQPTFCTDQNKCTLHTDLTSGIGDHFNISHNSNNVISSPLFCPSGQSLPAGAHEDSCCEGNDCCYCSCDNGFEECCGNCLDCNCLGACCAECVANLGSGCDCNC